MTVDTMSVMRHKRHAQELRECTFKRARGGWKQRGAVRGDRCSRRCGHCINLMTITYMRQERVRTLQSSSCLLCRIGGLCAGKVGCLSVLHPVAVQCLWTIRTLSSTQRVRSRHNDRLLAGHTNTQRIEPNGLTVSPPSPNVPARPQLLFLPTIAPL